MSSRIKCACAQCGKELIRFPSHLKHTKFGPFCDRDCLGLFRSAHLTGSLAANFKTGNVKDRAYIRILVPWHPNKDRQNKVHLHRIIVEAKLGRFLKEDEIVHHKDGNPENNHWDNLEVMSQAEHAKQHISDGTIEYNTQTRRFQKGRKHG
jgi:HNH endonuclease